MITGDSYVPVLKYLGRIIFALLVVVVEFNLGYNFRILHSTKSCVLLVRSMNS